MAAKRRATLTDRAVKALKPAAPGRRDMVWDAVVPNLAVRVTERGHKSFVVVRRRPGDARPIWSVLGAYNPDAEAGTAGTLADARAKAKDALAVITGGQHPREIEEERRREVARRREDTLASVAEEFIKRHVSKLRSARATEALIRRELLGEKIAKKVVDGKPVEEWVADPARKGRHWRERPITSITRRDAIELVEGIVDRGSRAQARKTFAAASKLFGWALARDTYGLEQSPCSRIKVAEHAGKTESRTRVLGDDELRLVWQAADKLGYPFGTLVKMLALTGQRLTEISSASWSEIENDVLTVPPERMKGKIAHTVPLAPEAAALLATLPHFAGFIFTTTGGKRPVSGFSKAKARLDREIAKLGSAPPPWTLHDIRRTVRTRLSGLGVLPLVAELVIAHKQGGIHAVYDLHRYDAEKRDALLRWERALRAIIESPPPNVVAPEEVERRRRRKRA
jgi:integrase